MGVFDIFGREKPKSERLNEYGGAIDTAQTKGPISVFKPTSFEDVEAVINALKAGKTAIVHLTDLKHDTQIRVLDMLSGAIYALNGGVYEMDKNVFTFSPSGLEIY